MSEPTIDFAMKPATEQSPVALPGIQSAYLGPANSASATATGGGGGGTIGTALPASPADGETFVFTDSTSAPTYAWQFVWLDAAAVWVFIGGTPLYGASGLAVPLAAIYRVEIGVNDVTTGSQRNGNFSWTGGGITLASGGGVVSGTSATNYGVSGSVSGVTATGLAALAAITVTSTGSVGTVYVAVTPVTAS